MNWLTKLIVNALAVFAAAYLLPGVYLASFVTAIIVAIVMSLLNLFLRPVLILLTIPIGHQCSNSDGMQQFGAWI